MLFLCFICIHLKSDYFSWKRLCKLRVIIQLELECWILRRGKNPLRSWYHSICNQLAHERKQLIWRLKFFSLFSFQKNLFHRQSILVACFSTDLSKNVTMSIRWNCRYNYSLYSRNDVNMDMIRVPYDCPCNYRKLINN